MLTIARFCQPQSELHLESTWYRSTALDDLLGVPVDKVHGTVRLRCVTEPDEAQKVLLHRLGVTLPRRLRRIDEIAQM